MVMHGFTAENMVVRDFRPPDYSGVAALWKASGISNPERDDSGDDVYIIREPENIYSHQHNQQQIIS